jgi:hypothetical protein
MVAVLAEQIGGNGECDKQRVRAIATALFLDKLFLERLFLDLMW